MLKAIASKRETQRTSIRALEKSHPKLVQYMKTGGVEANLIRILRIKKMITREQCERALIHRRSRKKMVDVLIHLDYINEDRVLTYLSRLFNCRIIDISELMINPTTVREFSYQLAKKNMVFPLMLKKGGWVLSMNNPLDYKGIIDVHVETGQVVHSVTISTKKNLVKAYKKYYKISDDECKSFFMG